MRTMKDSGVEWLGEVPDSWSISSLRRVARLKTGTTPEGAEYASEGDLAWVRPDDLVEEGGFILPTKFFSGIMAARSPVAQIGSTLICAIGTIGKASFVHQEVSFNQQITSVQPRGVEARFLFFLLSGARSEVESLSVGNVMHILNNSRFGALKVAVPSDLGEQHAIAGYLDQETSRIDSLISKKEQLIEKLLERRQALITQVVTKGLDPNVPMKDSGVEWLGEVPKGWTTKPIWSISKAFAGGTPESSNPEYWDDAEGTPWIAIGDMSDVTRVLSTSKAVSMLGRTIKRLPFGEPGDVLFAMYASVGATAILGIRATWNQAILGLRIDSRLADEKFVFFLLKGISDVWNLLSNSNTQANLNQHSVMHLRISLPGKSEQAKIAAYLDQETFQIDILVEKTRRAIELLKERRQALITQVVTGKIDVRGFAGGNS